jgi:hypothetical protein
VVVEGERLQAVHVYEADPVSCEHLRGTAWHAPAWRHFDPHREWDDLPPAWLGLHALRRLAAHPATRACGRLGIEAWGPYVDPLLDFAAAAGLGDRVTHLDQRGAWDARAGALRVRPRRLGDEFPNLRALSAASWGFGSWSAVPLGRLDRLRLIADWGDTWRSSIPVPGPPLAEILDRVADRAPFLRQLAIPAYRWDPSALDVLTRHPLLARLVTLELFNIHHPFDFEALLDARPRLAHLETVVLGSHLVPQEVLQRFADWPAVQFASHDRRELRAYDAAWEGRPR